jgi:hypothetical protein
VAGCLLLPGVLHPLPIQSIDIDRFAVELVTATLAERGQPVEAVLQEYSKYIHTWLATIHEQRIRSRIWSLQHSPHAETALILLVMSLITAKGDSTYSQHSAESSIYPLAAYLFSFLQFMRGPSLELAQGGLLLAVYETGSGRSQAAFITIGICARMGYLLRLNIDMPDPGSWAIAEERRRVWLGIHMMERSVYPNICKICAYPLQAHPPGHGYHGYPRRRGPCQ